MVRTQSLVYSKDSIAAGGNHNNGQSIALFFNFKSHLTTGSYAGTHFPWVPETLDYINSADAEGK